MGKQNDGGTLMSDHALLYRADFCSFVDFAFRELHGGEMMNDNWHIHLMSNLLRDAWLFPGEALKRLIVNLPPGYFKTHVCSIAFPAWIMGRDPRKSVLIVSETPELAMDLQARCVELMNSRRYRAIFSDTRFKRLARDAALTHGGGIRHAGAGHALPPRKSDLVVIDNPQSLHSLARFKPESFVEIGRTLKDPKRGLIVLATRRLAENDLSHFLGGLGNWQTFAFPAIALRARDWQFPPDGRYRQELGEPLHECLEDWEELEKRLVELGGEAFAYQYMQGQYSPQKYGHRDGINEHGDPVTLVGSFDPTTIAFEDLSKLKCEYLANSTQRDPESAVADVTATPPPSG
jgi:hypothetical protein